MNVLDGLFSAGVSFIFLALFLSPLERAFPAKPEQKTFRPDWFTDLAFYFGQYLVWTSLILRVLIELEQWCLDFIPDEIRIAVGSQPWVIQAIEVVLLGDLCIYWVHRLEHSVDFLWRFHSVHHSSEHLDWLAAHREHPVDGLITQVTINFPALLLGFDVTTLSWLIAFRGIWAIYIHSNVRLPLGPLRVLLGAPELHHWHHAKQRECYNFGNVSPLMDVIFGTYFCPAHEPTELGIPGHKQSGYFRQLVQPFLMSNSKHSLLDRRTDSI